MGRGLVIALAMLFILIYLGVMYYAYVSPTKEQRRQMSINRARRKQWLK